MLNRIFQAIYWQFDVSQLYVNLIVCTRQTLTWADPAMRGVDGRNSETGGFGKRTVVGVTPNT